MILNKADQRATGIAGQCCTKGARVKQRRRRFEEQSKEAGDFVARVTAAAMNGVCYFVLIVAETTIAVVCSIKCNPAAAVKTSECATSIVTMRCDQLHVVVRSVWWDETGKTADGGEMLHV